MTEANQEFNGSIEGGVAGRDIVHEAPHTTVRIGRISGGHNIIGQAGDIYLQLPEWSQINVVIQLELDAVVPGEC